MAHIVLTSNQSNLVKVVFENMTIETAKTIADYMNKLAEQSAKTIGNGIKLTYKVFTK